MAGQKRKAEPTATDSDAIAIKKFKLDLDRALNMSKKDFHGTSSNFVAKNTTRKLSNQHSKRINKSKLDLGHDLHMHLGGFHRFTDATAKHTATQSTEQDSKHINKLNQKPLQQFSLFGNLPPELRQSIWEATIDNIEPRVISLALTNSETPDYYLPFWQWHPKSSIERPEVEFSCRAGDAGLLSANLESRQALLKSHKSLFPEEDAFYPVIYAILENDIIHFGPDFEFWHVAAFAHAIGSDKTKQIKAIALEYEVKPGMKRTEISSRAFHICKMFENLQKLILIAHQKDFGSDTIFGAKDAPADLKLKECGLSKAAKRLAEFGFGMEAMSGWTEKEDVKVVQIGLGMCSRTQHDIDPTWNRDWKPPAVEFKEFEGTGRR